MAIAAKILELSAKPGFPAKDVLIDPLILTVSANQKAGKVTLTTIEMIAWEFSVNINLGTSNFRHTINQVFLAQAASADASCVITNPEKLPSFISVADLLLGRDAYTACFIKDFRKRQVLDLVTDGTPGKS